MASLSAKQWMSGTPGISYRLDEAVSDGVPYAALHYHHVLDSEPRQIPELHIIRPHGKFLSVLVGRAGGEALNDLLVPLQRLHCW